MFGLRKKKGSQNISIPIKKYEGDQLKKLRDSKREIKNNLRDIEAHKPKPTKHEQSFGLLIERVECATKSMAERTKSAIRNLTKRDIQAKKNYRQFQVDRGISHEAAQPNLLKTVLVIQCCILAEGIPTAMLMIADGNMDMLIGLIYGISVSALNITTGIMAGFFAVRYLTYKLHAPYSTLHDRYIRFFAWMAFIGSIIVMAGWHFTAARVRSTGSHEGLFNFSEVGLLDTFDDAHTLGILLCGVLGSILALYEGISGLSDPIPGYTKARNAAEASIQDTGTDVYFDVLDAIEQAFEEASENIEQCCDDARQEIEDHQHATLSLNDQIVAHNNSLDSAIDMLRTKQADDLRMREFIEQNKLETVAIDFDAFEALRIEELPASGMDIEETAHDIPDPTEPLSQLQAAYQEATTIIRESYSEFLNHSPEFTLNNQHGE